MSEENKNIDTRGIIEKNIDAYASRTGKSRKESFLYLIEEYACSPDEDLGKGPLELKRELIDLVDLAFALIHNNVESPVTDKGEPS